MRPTLTPPHITLGDTSSGTPCMKSAIWIKPTKVHKAPKANAASPISLTQAGAFQAAKKRPINNKVMTAIPKGPPETKS